MVPSESESVFPAPISSPILRFQGISNSSVESRLRIEAVLRDVLGLTKLNYNSCRFGDGLPVTLRFADAIGEILTCGPIEGVPPLRFSHYI
jgi:hypothetical protein